MKNGIPLLGLWTTSPRRFIRVFVGNFVGMWIPGFKFQIPNSNFEFPFFSKSPFPLAVPQNSKDIQFQKTPNFRIPQEIREPNSREADWWSIGILIYDNMQTGLKIGKMGIGNWNLCISYIRISKWQQFRNSQNLYLLIIELRNRNVANANVSISNSHFPIFKPVCILS